MQTNSTYNVNKIASMLTKHPDDWYNSWASIPPINYTGSSVL